MESVIKNRIANCDWNSISAELSASGFGRTGPILPAAECDELVSLYSDESMFRSHVVMERYRFGKGDYKYFRYPLPEVVASLRTATYPHLAKIANSWSAELGATEKSFPLNHREFLERCHRVGQKQPTPLVLHYEAGGY